MTLGYPNLKTTFRLIQEFETIGVDIIELGFPFSDPMADGPTIQRSSQYALDRGIKIKDAFALVRKLRRAGSKIPIVFFSYLNPVLQYGASAFARDAKKAGFDGLILPDLPPEEEPALAKACKKSGLSQIFLMAPTTTSKRAAKIAQRSEGFIYYVSTRGVTGMRKALPSDLKSSIRKIEKRVKKPLLVGFGVSSPKLSREFSSVSQGVIVGSALVEALRKSRGKIPPVVRFTKSLMKAMI